jgi:hypothetical protein
MEPHEIIRAVKELSTKQEASKKWRLAQAREFALMQVHRYGLSVPHWIRQGDAAYAGERARLAWRWGVRAMECGHSVSE